MPDIYHDFQIAASPERIFNAISTPNELDAWWTKRSAGEPGEGTIYKFWFAPEYDWRGLVRIFNPQKALEWEITEADADWTGTRVGFELISEESNTLIKFYHKGWPENNHHFRRSSYCWAMYLRILKRYIEEGERVPYEKRTAV